MEYKARFSERSPEPWAHDLHSSETEMELRKASLGATFNGTWNDLLSDGTALSYFIVDTSQCLLKILAKLNMRRNWSLQLKETMIYKL